MVIQPMDRREAVSAALAHRGSDGLLVTGLGSSTWDAAAAGDTSLNFYLWGGMGGAAAMGLGLALAQPDRPVCVLTGDGEMLMGVGSLSTIARKTPANLTILVLDNGHYGETGMQPSASDTTDLSALAAACGFDDSRTIGTMEDLQADARSYFAHSGLLFRRILIATGEAPRVLPEKDGVVLKERFRAAVLGG